MALDPKLLEILACPICKTAVKLEEDGKTVTGRGADTDTMVASAKAYVSALNKLMVRRERTAKAEIFGAAG